MAEPVLELDALVERRTVAIKLPEGRREYELRSSGEFSILDFHRLGKLAMRVDELSKVDESEITEPQVAELSGLLDRFCRLVLIAPDAVHERLGDTHRLRITQAFTDLSGGLAQTGEKDVEAPPAPSTGESKSPD